MNNERLIKIILRLQDEVSGNAQKASSNLSKVGNTASSVGNALTVGLTAPLVALGTLAAKTAIDFESAFAGVVKTVGGTTEKLAHLRNELEQLATSAESPVSALENAHMELFAIAEAAGQLGVAREDIVAFSDVMAQLAMTTDIAGEEGAAMIARFANVSKMPLSEIRQFGDAIATLGNNSAATEQEILAMSLRLASISELGFNPDEILAYSTALSSLGISAELGGTNFMKGVNEIAKAVAIGGAELEGFAQIAGMSSAEFSQAWGEDANAAFQEFLKGLSNLDADQRIIALERLGLSGSEMQRVFLSLAGSTDMLTDTLNASSAAFAGNGALMDEASKRAETTAGRMNRAKNMFNQVMADFGDQLIPLIVDLLEKGIIPLLSWINNLDASTRQWILGLLAVVAAIGPVLSLIGGLIKVFTMLSGVIPFVTTAFTAFLALGAPVIALIAAIIAAVVLLIANWESLGNTVSQLATLVIKGWEGIWKSISTTAGQIMTIFAQLPKKMQELGGAMMQGLWNGIVDGFKRLIVWILSSINDIVSKIRKALGIASPSKVMAKIGEQVVQGFNKGIEGMGGVGVNVNGASLTGGQPSLSAMPAMAGNSTYGGTVFNIYSNQDPKEIAREVDKIQSRNSQRQGARKTKR